MSYKRNTIYKWNNAFEGKFPTEGDLNEKLIVVKIGEGTWKNNETDFEKSFYLYNFEIIVKTFLTEKNFPKDQNISVSKSEVEWLEVKRNYIPYMDPKDCCNSLDLIIKIFRYHQ